MKIKRIGCLALAVVLATAVFAFVGCTAATEAPQLIITDASGKGTIVSDVIIRLDDASGNAPYVKDVTKIVEQLNEKVDELTQTADIYEVSYAGQNGDGAHIIRMTYSFEDINDYNRKTMRLFNSVPRSTRNSLSNMPRDYMLASWELTDNGNGTYNATFEQSGYIFTAINLWAYKYLLENDIPDAWDNTGDGQAAQYSPLGDAANTFIHSLDTSLIVAIGENVQAIKLYNGNTASDVSVTGIVSGTPITADASVTDTQLIVEQTVSSEELDTSERSAEKSGFDPWMLSTIIVAAATILTVVIVAATTKKNGGKL